ncbi:MAG: helix-turn-helix transcriptional regulator [Alphaproteobacteria bacterium]|nr:helix-turn-helix transcriptional regulator [Alphaproteobacteria bacterium]
MSNATSMAAVAALVGDTARAIMLDALIGGRALTAGELAFVAGVSAPTASAHLAKLSDGGMVTVVKQGRHRYFRLASPLVARMLEGIMVVASVDAPPRFRPRLPRDEALRLARTCYDHFAGRLGVALADQLVARSLIVMGDDAGELTEEGSAFLREFGVEIAPDARRHARAFCRPCLDWTERRLHLAGAVGASIARRCFALGWVARVRDGRALSISRPGADGFRRVFGIDIAELAAAVKLAA